MKRNKMQQRAYDSLVAQVDELTNSFKINQPARDDVIIITISNKQAEKACVSDGEYIKEAKIKCQ